MVIEEDEDHTQVTTNRILNWKLLKLGKPQSFDHHISLSRCLWFFEFSELSDGKCFETFSFLQFHDAVEQCASQSNSLVMRYLILGRQQFWFYYREQQHNRKRSTNISLMFNIQQSFYSSNCMLSFPSGLIVSRPKRDAWERVSLETAPRPWHFPCSTSSNH